MDAIARLAEAVETLDIIQDFIDYRDPDAAAKVAWADGGLRLAQEEFVMSEQMATEDAQSVSNKYVCGVCWAHLVAVKGDDAHTLKVCCSAYGDQHSGFVTKAYAEKRRSESLGELAEVEDMLREIGVLPKPEKKSEDELLKSLGF